jgi:GNAT superfamily N-acetyltransferase
MAQTLRPATLADADACGRICYEGFRTVNARHGFETNFPSVEAATNRVRASIEHPHIFGVVCEIDGTIAGFSFLSERDPIRAVGPIVIDPAVQARGIGRSLMAAVLDRARGARGVRLLQDSFNMHSLALYADLGFAVRDSFVVMVGTPSGTDDGASEVRRLDERDLAGCEALHGQVHGFSRTNELRDALATGAPVVGLRDGRVTAYMAAPNAWLANHGVAETGEDARALLLGAARVTGKPVSFLLPPRDAALFRWCVAAGLRAIKPMTLMTIGQYQEPRGSYFPSVLY